MAPAQQEPDAPEVTSDGLRHLYSSLADDGAVSARKREASMLFSIAEGHLDARNSEQALSTVNEALAIFRDLDDLVGMADTMRLAIHALRMQVSEASWVEDTDGARIALAKAETMASSGLRIFQDCGDRRGQAAMLLARAELTCHGGDDGKPLTEALRAAKEARRLLREVHDGKMVAAVAYTLSQVHFKMHDAAAANKAAKDAVELYRGISDKSGEAGAWRVVGSAAALDSRYSDAVSCMRRAWKLSEDVENKRAEAVSAFFVARYSLAKGDTQEALEAATSAFAIFNKLRHGNGWTAGAIGQMVEAHAMQSNHETAVAVAEAGLKHARTQGNERELVHALNVLLHAHHGAGDYQKALLAAEDGLAICAQLESKRMESELLEALAYVQIGRKDFKAARSAAMESVVALRDLGNRRAELKARLFGLSKVLLIISDFEGAFQVSGEALKLARQLGDRRLEGQATLALSATLLMMGQHDRAVNAGELAAEVFHEVGKCRIYEAKSWQAVAEAQLAAGQGIAALRAVKKAEALLEDFRDKTCLAKMLHTRVRIHIFAGELWEASAVALEALRICRRQGDAPGTLKSLFLVIEARVSELSADDAEDQIQRRFGAVCEGLLGFAREAVSLSTKLADRAAEGMAYNWVAHLQLLLGLFQDAAHSAQLAVACLKEVGSKAEEASALAKVAEAKMSLGDPAAAADCLRSAVVLAHESNNDMVMATVLELQELIQDPAAQGEAAPQPVPVTTPGLAAAAPAAREAEEMVPEAPPEVFAGPDKSVVVNCIMGFVQNLTGGAHEIFADSALMETGIDSLSSVELRTALKNEFRVSMPATVIFSYPTVHAIAQFLVDECSANRIPWGR